MKHINLFEEFLDEAYSSFDLAKIDSAYWAEYNDELPEDKSFVIHSTDFDQTFKTALDVWDSRGAKLGPNDKKRISGLAKAYFDAEGWISVQIVLAMFDQVAVGESITAPAQHKRKIPELVSMYRKEHGDSNNPEELAHFAHANWSNITGLPLNYRYSSAEYPSEIIDFVVAVTGDRDWWTTGVLDRFSAAWN
jgi:hypothetical protein